MGIVRKQGNQVSYEMKPRDIEKRFCTCDIAAATAKKELFFTWYRH